MYVIKEEVIMSYSHQVTYFDHKEGMT